MAVRYTNFFTYNQRDYALYILGNLEETGQYGYTIHIKSGDLNETIHCKNNGIGLEIFPQNRSNWIKEVEGLVLKILIKPAFTDFIQQQKRL